MQQWTHAGMYATGNVSHNSGIETHVGAAAYVAGVAALRLVAFSGQQLLLAALHPRHTIAYKHKSA